MYNFDVIIESYINGNISYLRESFEDMDSAKKESFVNYVKNDDYLSADDKLKIFIILLKNTFLIIMTFWILSLEFTIDSN